MVYVYSNPPPDRDFTHFHGFRMGGDPMKISGFNGSENSMLQNASLGNMVLGMDDPNKKIRKPYTITKSRESWTDQEHEKFIEALHLFRGLMVPASRKGRHLQKSFITVVSSS